MSEDVRCGVSCAALGGACPRQSDSENPGPRNKGPVGPCHLLLFAWLSVTCRSDRVPHDSAVPSRSLPRLSSERPWQTQCGCPGLPAPRPHVEAPPAFAKSFSPPPTLP